MSRIELIPRERFDPELAELAANRRNDLELGTMRIWAHSPELAKAFFRLVREMGRTTLSPRLVEVVRLRVAYLNQCHVCMAQRRPGAVESDLTEQMVCALMEPEEAAYLTPAERAALRYADLMATDHFAIGDSVFEDLRRHFTQREIVELGCYIAICVGVGRLDFSWDLLDDLPEPYRSTPAGDLKLGTASYFFSP